MMTDNEYLECGIRDREFAEKNGLYDGDCFLNPSFSEAMLTEDQEMALQLAASTLSDLVKETRLSFEDLINIVWTRK